MNLSNTVLGRPVPGAVAFDALRPWLVYLRPGLDGALTAWRAGCPVSAALTANRPAPADADSGPCFVPQSDLPASEAYEAFIHRSRQVPTRDNLHDFFNGLVWLARPALKWRLNALQAAEIAQRGLGAVRGPVRDALTLFDENGALLQGPPQLLQALRDRDWQALFITHRAAWGQARLTIIGHALLEKLATAPRKALCAHVLLADPLALDAAAWAGKPFAPLPVLGVPGWWPANELSGFYDDPAVFRPARSLQSTDSARRCRN